MNNTTSPHKLRREIIKDDAAYVEAVHKPDMENLGRILEMDGVGVVVRLFLGATEKMPVRILSYIMSAARVATIVPCEQLQIICVNDLGSRVNGIDKTLSGQQTNKLAGVASLLLQGFCPEVAGKTIFAVDKDSHDVDSFRKFAERAFTAKPEIENKLRQKGEKHGGDHLTYSAAHFMHQDTPLLELENVLGTTQPVKPNALVSVGCQQERLFHNARSAMREVAGNEVEIVPSAQVFTKHVSPPYFEARQGEQSMDDALAFGFDLRKTTDSAALRDLTHFQRIILGGINE